MGDFIGGQFLAPDGEPRSSANPARPDHVVAEAGGSPGRAILACEAAAAAAPGWRALSVAQRWAHLERFRDELDRRRPLIADALVAEIGKIHSEALGEAGSLVSRFGLVRDRYLQDLGGGAVRSGGGTLRYEPLGVVGVIGPFNYPLHLCHAHVVPALLAGNPVVVKPSELAISSARHYADAAEAAKMPPGVFNLVTGGGASGAAIAEHREVRGLCFTGSWAVGEKLLAIAARRPELLLALEMGGKNTAVVLDDADLRQAAHEIVVGAYLTTGQRCTATDRVLVEASRADLLCEMVTRLAEAIRVGDPLDPSSFCGPLVTSAARDKVRAAIARARTAGALCLFEGQAPDGGNFQPITVHRLDGVHAVPGYTDVEMFGPDVGIEIVRDEDEALEVLAASDYGFANSIFTASDARFDHVVKNCRAGIINRNRSTNLASPSLPFGGVGKSGNYRPAGAFAVRNVTVPVAVLERQLGEIDTHPQLASALPPPDLDGLEARQLADEAAEAVRDLVTSPRPMHIQLPRGGELPASRAWLDRLYAGNRVVIEKKPLVVDHLRSYGPWMCSVDDEPLCVLDGMSQTATLTAGFAADPVVRAYFEGEFGATLTSGIDTSLGDDESVQRFAAVLREQVPGATEVSFTNSGAEAVDKALALCRGNCPRPQATKILAFEGGFHGRTLWPLSATYNPAKREPYQIAGYEGTFAPFPVWTQPNEPEPEPPAGFYAAAAAGDTASLLERFGDEEEHGLLAREARSLAAVADALASGDYFACIVEPMQSEGGDRYATTRFFKALRLLTRHFETDLIFDEVQTGFGLGGPFAWHSRFRLVNHRGQPDYPDATTWAKRAQVGVVLSRYSDPEPTPTHAASLVRGRLHAESMATSHAATRIEKLTWPRLQALADAFPELVQNPRAIGYTIAFDLPSAAHLNAYIGQRFWRGAVVFAAGSKTVRYRLSEAYQKLDVELLFSAMRRQLAWLEAHPGESPPSWHDGPSSPSPTPDASDIRIRTISDTDEAVALLPAILDIEYRVYEPVRRTPPEHFLPALQHPDSVITVAEAELGDRWHLVGFGVGAPLELVADIEEGPDRDAMLGKHNALYSVSITVAPEMQGRGLGRAIKGAQLAEANQRVGKDGLPRYRHVTGRNRVGHTAPMRHLNRVFGAHVIKILDGQYEDPEGQAAYYRIPLAPYAPGPVPDRSSILDARSIAAPLASPPASLQVAAEQGLLYGAAVSKLTIMNYVTPAVVRALEWVSALLPSHPRLYLTSSRDETVDKTLRILRTHRPKAQVALGFDGGYVGHTTASARSISDPSLHRQGRAVFDWPRVPHPEDGVDATLEALDRVVRDAGGPDHVFGLFAEVVGERSGRVVSAESAAALSEWSQRSGVPIVAVEGATSFYRSGAGPFAVPRVPLMAGIVIWWGGAQTGYIHVTDRFRVDTPLTMVSTWDGDELSMIREHHALRALRDIDLGSALDALREADGALERVGLRCRGQGLYRIIEAGSRADALVGEAQGAGLALRRYPGGRVGFCPGLDVADLAVARLGEVARRWS